MSAIFHIVDRTRWAAAVADGSYRPESLDVEGFIHCSTRSQVAATIARYYADEPDLCVVEFDPALLTDVRYEDSYGRGIEFPHVYSAISVDAVVAVHDRATF